MSGSKRNSQMLVAHPFILARENQDSRELTPPCDTFKSVTSTKTENGFNASIIPNSYRECVEKPNWIARKHWQEWRDSGVNPGIIRLLVTSLDKQGAIDFIYKLAPRLKTDRSQYQSWVRRAIEHLTPGWACPYFDWQGEKLAFGKFKPDTPMPAYGDKNAAKYLNTYGVGASIGFFPVTIKEWYLASQLNGVPLPENILVKDTGEAVGFWTWVLENKIPIVIGEGEKKTACLLSNGIVAICLPGVNSLYRTVNLDEPSISEIDASRIRKYLDTCYPLKASLSEAIKSDCKALYEYLGTAEIVEKKTQETYEPGKFHKAKKIRYIVPELLPFALAGIGFTFCFDQDEKESTQKHVGQALRTAAKLLEAFGSEVDKVSWYYPEKGIDDVWNAHGSEALLEIFQAKESVISKFKNPLYVNSELLGKVEGIGFDNSEESYQQIVAWVSPKGTGKSKAMGDLVSKLFNEGYQILSLTHRIKLGEQNANNWGITHKGQKDLTGGFTLGLCVDSLLKSKGFKLGDWNEFYLLIDEIEQVLNHLLFSNTLAANRAEIYENFISVVRKSRGILLSDAYLSQLTIDLLAKICTGNPKIKTVVNTYKPDKKIPLVVYESAADLIAVLDEKIGANPDYKCLIQTDSVSGSKGTDALFEKYSGKFPNDQILQFDRVTTRLKGNPANGLLKFLEGTNADGEKNTVDDFLSRAKMVLASPVWGTGVSLGEKKELFDDVFLILSGVQDLLSTGQNFNRYRRDCTRHLFIPKFGLNRFGGGETNKVELLKAMQQNAAVAAAKLLKDITEDQRIEHQNAIQEHQILTTLSDLHFQHSFTDKDDAFYLLQDHALSLMVKHNKTQYNLRGELLDLLEDEGIWDISFIEADPADEKRKERNTKINKELNEIKKGQFEAKVKAIASDDVPVLAGSELETLKNLSSTTTTQNLIVEKSETCLAYPVLNKPEKLKDKEFSLDLWRYVLKDKSLYSKLRRLYYFAEGREFLAERDFKKALAHFLKGKVNLPGFVKSQMHYQIVVLEFCNVSQFLDTSKIFTQSNLTDWYQALLPYRKQIRNVLGVSMVNESNHKKWLKANTLEQIPENDRELDPNIHQCIVFAKALLGKIGLTLSYMGRNVKEERAREYVFSTKNQKYRKVILADWRECDRDKKELESQAVFRSVQGSGKKPLEPLQDAGLGVIKNQNQKLSKNAISGELHPLQGAGLEPRPGSPINIYPTTKTDWQDTPLATHQETPLETPLATHQETHQDTHQDTHQETPLDTHQEAYQETHQEAYQEAYQETHQEAYQEAYQETPLETPQDDWYDWPASQAGDLEVGEFIDNPDDFESDWSWGGHADD